MLGGGEFGGQVEVLVVDGEGVLHHIFNNHTLEVESHIIHIVQMVGDDLLESGECFPEAHKTFRVIL